MPQLLFKLNGVAEDEVIEMRQLLDQHRIDYYETHAGLMGVSLAAIWLRDHDDDLERAKALIDEYQQQRYQKARAEYEQQQRDGTAETQLQRIFKHPVRTIIFVAIILVVLYFSTMPFWMLTR